jgi:hypothetical protein
LRGCRGRFRTFAKSTVFVRARLSGCEVASGFCAGDGADDGGGVGFDDDGLRVGGGELEAVEEDGGAFGVDAIAGEGGDEEGDGDLDGLGVFDGREVEFDGIVRGVIGQVLGAAGCRCDGIGVGLNEGLNQGGAVFEQVFVAAVEAGVEVAEGGEAEGWGLAASSVGFDVAAGGGWHFWLLEVLVSPPSPPRGYFGGK